MIPGRRILRDIALLTPPLRRLYEFAKAAEAGRLAALTDVEELRAALEAETARGVAAQAALQDLRAALEAETARGVAAQAALQDLHTTLNEEKAARLAAVSEVTALREAAAALPAITKEEMQSCAHWAYLKRRNQLLELDFPVVPKTRHGYGRPSDPLIMARLKAGTDHYARQMQAMLPLVTPMLAIPAHPDPDDAEPNWINPAFPALDAIALYGILAQRRPKRLIEIGSGFSTKFARRAVRDHGLDTRIISIDPEPRAEVDAICDEVMRLPLEQVPIEFFESVTPDDVVFFDGSHRAFQNSDVTVFFTEILPRLSAGTTFGIHDVYLPDDYPPDWLEWYFSEQYMLSCWLLAGASIRVDFPAHFIGMTDELHDIFLPMWKHESLAGAYHRGGAFFATVV